MKRLLLFVVAALALAVPAAQGATAAHTVDLTTGRVDGHYILGRMIAGVTAALGRPDFRVGGNSRYRLGWGEQPNFSLEVNFRRSGGVQRAWSIVFERGPVRDAMVGNLLQPSAALQRAIVANYGTTFKLVRPYACKTEMLCVGDFAARNGPLHLTFGTQPVTGTWLTIWKPLPGD